MRHPAGTRRAIAISLLFAIGLAALVGTVAWGSKLKTTSSSTSVESADAKPVSATCPRGTKAISGGFAGEYDDLDPMSPAVAPIGSRPSDKRDWEARAFNRSGFTGELIAFAYCRDEKLKGRSESVVLEPPPGPGANTVSLTPTCPSGTKAVSGGFDNPDAFAMGSSGALVFPYRSLMRGQRRWLAAASNVSNEKTTFKAFIRCRDGESLKTKRNSEAAETDEGFDLAARCARKQRVVSGGFDLEEPYVGGLGPTVFESRKQGKRGWTVSGVNTGEAVTVTAFAYCEPA
jgi:hypothetical protein